MKLYALLCLVYTITAASSKAQSPQQPIRLEDEDIHTKAPPLHPSSLPIDPYSDEALFSLHRDLVDIDSTPGKEHTIGVYLEKYLQALNFTVERQYIDPPTSSSSSTSHDGDEHDPQIDSTSRFNVLAYTPGHRSTPLLLTSHMDTVPIFYPYNLNPKTGKISGRGSVDDKACVASQIQTFLRLRRSSPSLASKLAVLFVTGEEVNGDGMKRANDLALPWSHVIFGEPTEGKLASGHKGLTIFKLVVHGKATHSGYPWLGHSANEGLLKALNALNGMQLPYSAKYGNSTMNIGLISGGTAANVMPELAMAEIAIRIAAGRSAAPVRNTVLSTLAQVEGEDIGVEFLGAQYGPVDIDHDVDGFETITVNYGTDIPNLDDLGGRRKRYLYGPGSILVAHSDHENLYKKDLVRAVEDYERLVRALGERV